MNNYNDFQNYYRAMPNNNVMEDRNWNFNMNTNINPVIDEQKITLSRLQITSSLPSRTYE